MAMITVDDINKNNGSVRLGYQACVASSAFGYSERWEPFSVEEACIASIILAVSKR